MKKYNYKQKKITIQEPDGTTKRKTIYAKTEKELKEKIRKAEKEAEDNLYKTLHPLFNDVADEWNEVHESEISHYTYSCYQAPLNDLKSEFENMQITDITSQDIQQLINSMHKKGFAKHTLALRKIVATQIFDYAIIEKKGVKFNPANAVKIPRSAPTKNIDIPSDKEINIVKQSVDAPFGLFAYLVLYTGCRRGEALALKWDDIDFENNLIHINKVVVFKYGKPEIKHRAKSKDGIRSVPLLAPLKNVLKKGKGFIFNINGNPLTLSQFNSKWNKYIRATGLTLSPHQLRHAFATICFDAGIEAKDASEILGHSKIQLTLDVYTHIRKSRKKETFDKLNNYLTETT